jgi:nucleotide-binding universal stress UspA family protein
VKAQLKTILSTTDFSDTSRAGVRYAMALAEALGADVTLLNVVEPPSRMAGMEVVALARTDSEVAALARVQLRTFVKREAPGGVTCAVVVRTGKPFHEIALAARAQLADVIVIGTHGYTGAKHLLLGSTAERVVRHAPCPVLTVPARAQSGQDGKMPAFKLKKILVPIDFSNISADALPYVLLLAGQFSAEVILISVVETYPIDHILGDEVADQLREPAMRQAESDLQAMAAHLGKSTSVRPSAIVRQGTPFVEICLAAKTQGADMIVLTTHGYTGLKHVWLGSTAERVVRHAACPVLVVRAREHECADGPPAPIQA